MLARQAPLISSPLFTANSRIFTASSRIFTANSGLMMINSPLFMIKIYILLETPHAEYLKRERDWINTAILSLFSRAISETRATVVLIWFMFMAISLIPSRCFCLPLGTNQSASGWSSRRSSTNRGGKWIFSSLMHN